MQKGVSSIKCLISSTRLWKGGREDFIPTLNATTLKTNMNTPRLLFSGLFLPPHTPGNRMFTRKYSFLSVGLHLAIMATFLSRSRDLFFALLTDVVIGLLLNVTHYMPFLLPDAPHRTDYSQSEGDRKHFFSLLL